MYYLSIICVRLSTSYLRKEVLHRALLLALYTLSRSIANAHGLRWSIPKRGLQNSEILNPKLGVILFSGEGKFDHSLCFFFSSSEIPKLNQRLAKSQRENECLQEKVKHLTLVADTVELKTQQLQTSLQQGNELQSRCRELQKETLGKRTLTFQANFQVKWNAKKNFFRAPKLWLLLWKHSTAQVRPE